MLLRQGQRGLPRASGTVFAGRLLGTYRTVTAHFGPWGLCLVESGGGTVCNAGRPGPASKGGSLFALGVAPTVETGALPRSVQAMVLTLSDGRRARPRLVPVGGLKFYTLVVTKKARIMSWAAFGAAGHPLGAGQGEPG
jgi:hypothetical protein